MNPIESLSWKDWLKGGLAGLAYPVGTVIGGMLFALTRLPQPPEPPGAADLPQFVRGEILASILLGLSLVPLARGLAGTLRTRWLVLATLLYVCVGVNTIIEISIFMPMYAHGRAASTASILLPAAILCGAALAFFLAPPASDGAAGAAFRGFLSSRSAPSWSVRFALAILAFPLAYFVFGMMIAPIVKDTYQASVPGVIIPPLGVILRTQILRSCLFLLASLPPIVLWRNSRLRLIVALGLAHTVLVGLFGLSQAYWMPMLLRVVHSIEITADSFLYAAALTLLLSPKEAKRLVERESPMAAA